MANVTLTAQEEAEVKATKRTLPFQIVYGAKHPVTGEFRMGADYTRRKMNKLIREGWAVFEAKVDREG